MGRMDDAGAKRLPPPVWGRDGAGGAARPAVVPPTPIPSPQGGGEAPATGASPCLSALAKRRAA